MEISFPGRTTKEKRFEIMAIKLRLFSTANESVDVIDSGLKIKNELHFSA